VLQDGHLQLNKLRCRDGQSYRRPIVIKVKLHKFDKDNQDETCLELYHAQRPSFPNCLDW